MNTKLKSELMMLGPPPRLRLREVPELPEPQWWRSALKVVVWVWEGGSRVMVFAPDERKLTPVGEPPHYV